MAVLSFEAAGGRQQAQRERAWSADADKGRRPPHHPRTFRPLAAAMRRCKQGAMRKILKYAAIVLVLLLVAAGIAFYVMSRPDAAHFSIAELSGRVPVMAAQHPEMFPTMNVPEATSWPANAAPTPEIGRAPV